MKGFLQLFICLFLFQLVHGQKDCRHSEYEERTMAAYPALSRTFPHSDGLSTIKSKNNTIQEITRTVPDIIRIPVVVHILFNKDEHNISIQQVISQIEALNRDFRGINGDRKKVPAHFFEAAADCGIEFQLAKLDPSGSPTNGVIRKWTSTEYFGLDDKVKQASKPWDANHYLNIWVCNLASGVLGYSSTPGGPLEKDGVVISVSAFGTTGKLSSSFDMGRTATHELGHWLNLRHIWGDTYCGDDKVDDTPKQRSANRGCPSGKRFSCSTDQVGDMYMNFMDLTDDPCMVMFTNGQKARMRELFVEGGLRNALLSSKGLDSSYKVDSSNVIPSENPGSPVLQPVAKAEISIFPNPVSNFLSVSIEDGKDADARKELVIYDHTGKPVMKETMTNSRKTFNISQLKPGLYYVNIIEGDKRTIRKFMKL